MERIVAGVWEIEYDRDATRRAYTASKTVKQKCDCLTCKNYYIASQKLPANVQAFFDNFGIEPTKPAEIYCNGVVENGRVLYGGFYHIVGKILSGADVWQPVGRFFEKKKHRIQVNMLKLEDDYEIGFTYGAALVENHFPQPVCQMEVSFWVPWVIDEPMS